MIATVSYFMEFFYLYGNLARCISTNEAQQYVSKNIPRHLLISRARECARLVCNIWVLKSELLYPDQSSVLQHARDLVLCLFSSNLPVRR